jgi:TRAP-type C4-dicarboxylate transport system permease small subunit
MLKSIAEKLDTVLIAIASTVLGLDLLAAFTAVVLSMFGKSYALFHELPRLSMSCVAFLGIGLALRSGGHISVDAFLFFLKGRLRTVLEVLIYLIICVAAVFLFWASLDTMLSLRATGQVAQAEWEIPLWYLYLFQLTGFTVLFLYSLVFAVGRVIHLINPKFGAATAPLTGGTTE